MHPGPSLLPKTSADSAAKLFALTGVLSIIPDEFSHEMDIVNSLERLSICVLSPFYLSIFKDLTLSWSYGRQTSIGCLDLDHIYENKNIERLQINYKQPISFKINNFKQICHFEFLGNLEDLPSLEECNYLKSLFISVTSTELKKILPAILKQLKNITKIRFDFSDGRIFLSSREEIDSYLIKNNNIYKA